jgi:hypothetical protein
MRMETRRNLVSTFVACWIWALASCQPAQAPPQATISLRLSGTPPEATVVIDDQPLGSLDYVSSRGVALPAGTHRISVTAVGYLPWDQEVEAKPGSALIRLQVALVPVPD